MPGKKDVRKFGLILSVEVESDCLFVISLEQRMDRCQLISVNKTFPLFNGHFGEILSHAVTVGQFTFPAFTALFTLIEPRVSSFLAAAFCTGHVLNPL